MAASFDLPIVVTGGPADLPLATELDALLGADAPVSLVGKLTLGQAFSVYRRATLMVTCDTGPMHAAAALGTRVVALFGPTWPERNGPWGEGHTVVQAKRPPIHRMYRYDARRTYMKAIDVDSVYEAVSAALQSGRSSTQSSCATSLADSTV